ncbi:MAG: tetratricopeptide (TPR) repeat protein [Planctomycetota bacterium]|jgi:tetratricopeptide (TPR) repeat protein
MASLKDYLLERFRLWRAESLLASGRYVSASRYLALTSSGQGRDWRLKGRLFGRVGLPVAAVQCFRQAVRAPGSTLEDILELSFGLVGARDFEHAQSVLYSYLNHAPDDLRAQRLLAHIYRAQGRFSTALDVLKKFRPNKVAAKYANKMPPIPKLAWRPAKAWTEALAADNNQDACWLDPALMAADPQNRDRLLCYFDELSHGKGGKKALAHGVATALASGESWLMPWVRVSSVYLKLSIPPSLPSFIARYGAAQDKHILLAGLTAGRAERHQSAIALISLGFTEYQEVLDEMRLVQTSTGEPEFGALKLEGHAIIQSQKRI